MQFIKILICIINFIGFGLYLKFKNINEKISNIGFLIETIGAITLIFI